MAHAAGGAALQPVVHQFDYLQPNAAEFESSETWWNVAWWFVFIGYTLLAVSAALFVGLAYPAQAPIAALATYLSLSPAANYADRCAREAVKYHELAEIEYEVADALEHLPQGPDDIQIARINRAVPQALRLVAARYLYWDGTHMQLEQRAAQVLARPLIPAEWPQDRREEYQRQLDAMPQDQRQIFETQRLRGLRWEAFGLHEQALRAKVEAANFHATLCVPERGHNNLRHIVRFESSPQDGSAPRRLAERALAIRYPVAGEVVDPYITFLGEQRGYSFGEIEHMPENALSALFQQPRVLIIPPEELYARR